MTTVAELNHQRKLAGLPLIRFDLRKLRAEDVQELREAYAALYEISETAIGDNRGYIAIARGHGYDQDLCHRDNRIFLTWHRSYVYAFEKALSSALKWKRGTEDLELTLPYWDWTVFDAATDAANGIPKVVDDATYVDGAGNTVPNPLARARSLYRTTSQGLTGDDEFTRRYPTQLRGRIPLLADDVERYLTNPDFASFSNDFDFGAHGTVHVVVGGTAPSSPLPGNAGDMRSVVSASYDPIFWLHHSMVDKVWFDWQTLHPGVSVPAHVLTTPVYGGDPGSTYIDAEGSLRYIYSSDSVEAAIAASGTVDDDPADSDPAPDPTDDTDPPAGSDGGGSPPEPPNRPVYVGTVTGPFVRAQLDFHQLRPPKDSYEIRAYIDNPDCNAETGYQDKSYAGRLVLFGHGQCHGARGHCNPKFAKRDDYDIRAKHALRFEHTRYCLDLTRGLRRYLANKKRVDDVTLYLVTVTPDGEAAPAKSVRYSRCSLRTFG